MSTSRIAQSCASIWIFGLVVDASASWAICGQVDWDNLVHLDGVCQDAPEVRRNAEEDGNIAGTSSTCARVQWRLRAAVRSTTRRSIFADVDNSRVICADVSRARLLPGRPYPVLRAIFLVYSSRGRSSKSRPAQVIGDGCERLVEFMGQALMPFVPTALSREKWTSSDCISRHSHLCRR